MTRNAGSPLLGATQCPGRVTPVHPPVTYLVEYPATLLGT